MNRLGIGFIGAGGVARVHMKNIGQIEHAKIVAVTDIQTEAAKRAASEYNARAYADAEQMMDNENLDAIFLCVPPFAHSELEEKVVARNIHLMVEKPVELELSRAKEKAKMIESSGIINASGYCLRYWDLIAKAKELLGNQTVAMVRGQYLSSFVNTPWYRHQEKSGGQLVEQSTHIVDLVRYLAGDVQTVSADMALTVSKHIEGLDIPDVSSVNMRHFIV
ncbi:dehydrogenase [Geomicrobium sp. JCM 19037]|uniref:Gfo/Idh/MocA family protein n=1 Tax=Geomicrobium sp. JCM 19037 TaxID=1460634 RepID=UPI00045F397E|nr:Gfo/Idh/MocA family oxidoreductase [Geomicrobium sp. JCM 19037]GAK02690.1 dehydrogenase [Geomicrobium sp. JCM 19037]